MWSELAWRSLTITPDNVARSCLWREAGAAVPFAPLALKMGSCAGADLVPQTVNQGAGITRLRTITRLLARHFAFERGFRLVLKAAQFGHERPPLVLTSGLPRGRPLGQKQHNRANRYRR